MARYSGGMFIRINTTIEVKYIPMIWEKKRTRMLELLELDNQMKNLLIVSRSPLVEVTVIIPTLKGESVKLLNVLKHKNPYHYEGQLL